MAIADPPCLGENRLQIVQTHACMLFDSGDMLKFIRQKRGAECEHSEEVGEVDKRHKLTLSTWSDNVNLKALNLQRQPRCRV